MAEKLSHKERTRARILDEAAMAMREHGSNGIGVANLMKRAGLTHGGFYAHFENRDDLVAHAVTRMFRDTRDMLDRHLPQGASGPGLGTLIDSYLSERRLDRPDHGCPIPSLLAEAPRMPAVARANFEAGVEAFRTRIRLALDDLGYEDPEGTASSVLAEMVGSAMLARSITDRATAEDVLRISREKLKERLGLAMIQG